jgi:pimeloyl-ACP methyl ester carboxylesterase
MDFCSWTRRTAVLSLLAAGGCASTAISPMSETALATGRHGPIEVTTYGPLSGPTVIMIPSLGRGAHDFLQLATELAANGYRVLCPQPRGIGASAPLRVGAPLTVLAEDVADVVQALAHRKPVFVLGHAFGNRVARMFASSRPDLTEGVILLAAGGKVAMPPEIEHALVSSFDMSLPHEVRMGFVAKAFFAPGNDPAVWRTGWWRDVAEAQIAATESTPVEAWWEGGTAPILVIQPKQDVLAPAENAERLRAAAPERVQVVFIDQAGHALLPEQPRAVAKATLEFLNSMTRSGRSDMSR